MNRRASYRYPGVLQVSLYQDNRKIAICQADNVCRDGIFIRSKNAKLMPDLPLEIEFTTDEAGLQKRARIKVALIHCTEDGVGLEFMEPTTREEILAHALLGYANRRFRVCQQSSTSSLICGNTA